MVRQIPANLDWNARYPSGRPISLRIMLVFHGPASLSFSSGVIWISYVPLGWPSSVSGWVMSCKVCRSVLQSELDWFSSLSSTSSQLESSIVVACVTSA